MATNFLWYTGSSAGGGLVTSSALTLMTTEYVGIASSAMALGATTFTSTYTGQAILGDIFYTYGSSQGSAQATGSNIAGWFLTSPDGTVFESSALAPPPRSPDFVVALTSGLVNTAITYKAAAVTIPALKFRVLIQNNTGVTSPTTNANGAPTIQLAPYAVQY